jgi:5-methylcytosine-specific restriction endonuclease McrA
VVSVAEAAAALQAEADRAADRVARKGSPAAKKSFRASLAWRRTRYAILAENAARNNGTARCELCGTTAAPGKPLHVDHIEAVSKNWARRFDKSNLQILCQDCNVVKLDGPAVDFRSDG